ncbi:MAG: LmeA family phospholipid-binding protein [Pseudonocardiaceae bacterium]
MRKLVIAAVVLVGLGIATDYGAAAAAEYEVAKQIRAELGLAADPSVRINGFPFLTQALSGHYSAIETRATGLSVGPLHDVAVEATMRDVDAPLSEVTSGNLQSVYAAEVDGRIRVRDGDLGRAIGIEDLRLQPASAEETQQLLPEGALPDPASRTDDLEAVRMVATTDLAGAPTGVIGIGIIKITGSRLQITITDVRLARDGVGEVSLPRPIRELLIQTLSTDVTPGGLPFTVLPTRVWVEPGSLVVEGTARGVSLGELGAGVG